MDTHIQNIPVDKDGYLLDYTKWNDRIACIIAEKEEIILTQPHWEIIYFTREFYQQYKTSPSVRMLIKAITQKLGEEKANSRYLQHLFPKGIAKQATKLAGLPKPAKCL